MYMENSWWKHVLVYLYTSRVCYDLAECLEIAANAFQFEIVVVCIATHK